MPNKNYIKGRAKEYRLMKELRDEGWTVLRTAGSHGFADLIAIKAGKTCYKGEIRFIQVKPDNYTTNQIKKLINENKWVDGTKHCYFMVL